MNPRAALDIFRAQIERQVDAFGSRKNGVGEITLRGGDRSAGMLRVFRHVDGKLAAELEISFGASLLSWTLRLGRGRTESKGTLEIAVDDRNSQVFLRDQQGAMSAPDAAARCLLAPVFEAEVD